jgi:hypothetical protein
VSPGLAALLAVLGCQALAGVLAVLLAAFDRFRVTVSVGPARRKTGGQP